MEVKKIIRKDIMVKLPKDAGNHLRVRDSGIIINTLSGIKYNPTHGTVVMMSDGVENCRINDEVFFGNHIWENAKEAAFGSLDEKFKHYQGNTCFAVKDGEEWYAILPERDVYFIDRNGELIPINDYVIAEPYEAPKEEVTASGLIIPNLKEESYYENMAKIVVAPTGTDLETGDVVYTLRHCDIPAEEPLNNPMLPKLYFFIELDNIVAKQ